MESLAVVWTTVHLFSCMCDNFSEQNAFIEQTESYTEYKT